MTRIPFLPLGCVVVASFIAHTSNAQSNSQLLAEPQVVSRPPMYYPIMASQALLEARVTVEVEVGRDGKPHRTFITGREPEFVYIFDNDVRKWVMKWTFTPARDRHMDPVPCRVSIPVSFKIREFKPGTIISQPDPEFPDEALEMGMEGWVGLAVFVNKEGLREGHPIVMSREPATTDVFDKAAIAVAEDARYSAAISETGRADSWIFMKVEFHLPRE